MCLYKEVKPEVTCYIDNMYLGFSGAHKGLTDAALGCGQKGSAKC